MLALITGASSGIGRDMARVLAGKGYDLIVVARREGNLRELAEELSVKVEIITLDLSVKENCFLLYNKVENFNIDVFVNNAGFGAFGEFENIPLEKELDMIDVNITAVHILTKLFLKKLQKQNNGYILNVASSAAFLPGPLMATYYATKAYVANLTRAIYKELKKENSNVHICALCPGPVKTEFEENADVKFYFKALSSEYVARYGIEKMFKKKLIIIPGTVMKISNFLLRFVPETALLEIAYNMQKRKRK